MDTPLAPARLSVEAIRSLVHQCLQRNGCNAVNAAAVADVVSAAERDGCPSHGLFRVPGYVSSLRNGKVNGGALPTVESTAKAVLRVDGDSGYAPTALRVGLNAVKAVARTRALCALSVTNCFHYGPFWFELEDLAEAGFAVIGFLPSAAQVAPAGATQPFFGTNPMGFAWPRAPAEPMVVDQSTATRARGEVMIAARQGQPVPLGVGLDADGQPTTDPKAILEGGVQLPFGGYKGSAIGMMIELLGAGLLGADFGYEAAAKDNRDGGPTRGGELLLVLNPDCFGNPQDWRAHCEAFFSTLTGLEGVRLPADRRRRQRADHLRNGVVVDAALLSAIHDLC